MCYALNTKQRIKKYTTASFCACVSDNFEQHVRAKKKLRDTVIYSIVVEATVPDKAGAFL